MERISVEVIPRRYREMSDEDLDELVTAGVTSFTPAAWYAISAELARRRRTPRTAQIAVEERVEDAKQIKAADRVAAVSGLFGHSLRFTRFMVSVALAEQR